MMPARALPRRLAYSLALLLLPACGGAEPVAASRGAPPAEPGKAPDGKASRRSGGAAGGPAEPAPAAAPEPARPKIVLTRDDFGPASRDPFQNFMAGSAPIVEAVRPRAEREVKLAEFAFEDLRLVAIVNSGRNIVPRALFVASDGRSKSVSQGEYFSRAEVLLASVNRDYVEIEVIDEELATSLNMTRGERRAIYLKTN
jgi:hypothetical protein